MRLKGDQVSAGSGESESNLLGDRRLASASEQDADFRSLFQRIQLEVIDHMRSQRGRGAFVRGETYREFLHARFLDDHRDEQASAGFLNGGCTDAAPVADGDFRRFGVGGLEVEERYRCRLRLGVRLAREAIAVQDDGAFALFGFELQEGGGIGERGEGAQRDPLGLACSFDLGRSIVLLAGDLAGQRGRLAGRHGHQRLGVPFALLRETHEREDPVVAVELRGDLAAGLDELGTKATRVGRFQSDLIG